MGLISIGTFTPDRNPVSMTVIQADKPAAIVQTYGGVAYFAWPATIVGKELELTWNMMSAADWAALDALYAADAVVVFDPNDDSGRTFNINLTALTGKYYMRALYRSDVKLKLLIMSEIQGE